MVVDIDQTCIFTMSKSFNDISIKTRNMLKRRYPDRIYFVDTPDADEVRGSDARYLMWGFKRNGLREFITYLHERFKYVIFWTAGTNGYARKMIPIIYRGNPGLRPFKVFSREHCTFTPEGDRTKPLSLLSKMCGTEISVPVTFLIDDQIYSSYENPDNGILIPVFKIKASKDFPEQLDSSESALEKLSTWLERDHVKEAEDIRLLSKKNIF